MNQQSKKEIIATMLAAKRPDLANVVAKTTVRDPRRVATAGTWLPSSLDPKETKQVHDLVSHVANTIKWDVFLAGAIAVALLEDVNAHPEAKAVNDILSRTLLQGR